MSKQFEQNSILWLAILALAAFCVSTLSPVSYTTADPTGTLITAQALAQKGTLRLDDYQPWMSYSYRFDYVNGHYYYIYPIGTPLFVTPIVWATGLTGAAYWPYSQTDDNLQNLISGLTVSACALLMYVLAKAYLPPLQSFLLASAYTFGTTIMSTMGTALWSSNLAVLFALGILILLVYAERGEAKKLNPYFLGILLFSMFLCRPQMVLLVGLVWLYIFIYRRKDLLRLSLTMAVLMALFIIYSVLELKQVLPIYYRSSDFSFSADLLMRVFATLLSPSRGLIIFSPFLILALIGSIMLYKALFKDPIYQLAGLWFLAHFCMISAWRVWWGGQSYGPRLFTDALPALFLLNAIVWQTAQTTRGFSRKLFDKRIFISLVLVSVFIHSYQGMFNIYTATWNDGNSVKFNDWRYPEFLANPQMLAVREVEYQNQNLPVYQLGNPINIDSPFAVYENWYGPEKPPSGQPFRWSKGNTAGIYFRVGAADVEPNRDYQFKVRMGGLDGAKIQILLNDKEIGSTPLKNVEPEVFTMRLPGSLIKPDSVNQLTFKIDFSFVTIEQTDLQKDQRMRGISFYNLVINP
jgi:hypothetical protein